MNILHNKKGYFFIIDALIAMTILSIGLFMLMSSFVTAPPKTQIALTSTDILEFLTLTTMREFVDSEGIVDKRELLERGSLGNSIAEQIIEYRYLSEDLTAENLASEALNQIVPIQYNVRLIIGDNTIFQRSISNTKDANLLLPARAYVVTVFNLTQVIGPYEIEVDVWQ